MMVEMGASISSCGVSKPIDRAAASFANSSRPLGAWAVTASATPRRIASSCSRACLRSSWSRSASMKSPTWSPSASVSAYTPGSRSRTSRENTSITPTQSVRGGDGERHAAVEPCGRRLLGTHEGARLERVAEPHGRPDSHAWPARSSPRSRTSSRVARSNASASTPSSRHCATHLSRSSSPIDQKCATCRPSGRAIDSSSSGAASSKLLASAIARATPYCAVRRAESRSWSSRRRAINTDMAPPMRSTAGRDEVPVTEKEVVVRDRDDRHRDHEGGHRDDQRLASRRAGRRDQRSDQQQLNEQRDWYRPRGRR